MSAVKRPHQRVDGNGPMAEIFERLETQALADYAAHAGLILLASHVECTDARGDSFTLMCDPPARLRVERTDEGEIKHWCDNWLDPYWNVSAVEPHPAFANGTDPSWVYGPSYCTDGRTEPSSDWTLERTTLRQKIADWWRR